MTPAATTMRLAFEKAHRATSHTDTTTRDVNSALRRKVGLTQRRTMWSIQRGKR